jgi:hypothetical protein
MSDGATHHFYYKKIFFPIILPVSIAITFLLIGSKINPILFLVFCFIQYWLASFIGPDLDLPGLNDDDGRMMRFGKKLNRLLTIFGYLTVAYWFFYAWIMSLFGGHRSKLSHGIIIGTVGRIVYFNIPVFLGLFLFYRYGYINWGWRNFWYQLYMDFWFYAYIFSQFVIWNLTDGLHLALDSKWFKRYSLGEK